MGNILGLKMKSRTDYIAVFNSLFFNELNPIFKNLLLNLS